MSLWDDFIQIVDYHFGYLVNEFSFKKVSTEIPYVIFESDVLRVSIFYEYGGRYELDLEIELLENPGLSGKSVSISQIVNKKHFRKIKNLEWLLVDTKDKVDTNVKEIAQLLYKYGKKTLAGDLSIFR